jgi:molecular chaperone DnaK
MSKEDIDKAVRDDEMFAEQDKKQKEAVDTKNHAESLIFQSEKTLADIGDKVAESDLVDVKAAIEKLKETVKTDDTDAIKADTEALEKAFYAVSEKLYRAQAEQGGAQGDPNPGAQGDGTYYDTNFEDNSK